VKVVLIAALCVLCAVAVAGADVDVDTEVDTEMERPPRAGKKLVSPRVLTSKAMMPKHRIIMVPKGDPRARAPQDLTPAGASSTSILRASQTCVGLKGSCIPRASCSSTTSSVVTGLCPGATYCCVPKTTTPPTPPQPPVDLGSCPVYAGLATTNKAGNGNIVYATVPIAAAHMVDTSKIGLPDNLADNTMRLQPTACAFARMAAAAAQAGVTIKIASGFRTYARQKYFWDCYQTKRCNGGNLAAFPGNSNHGVGLALDLNTDCGKQPSGSRPAPALCKSSRVYTWLLANARTFGFVRSVPTEPWHGEYRAGAAMPSYALF